MRAPTAQQSKVLDLPDGYQARVRALVKDGAGAFRDYSTLEGMDWLTEVRWSEDIDQPVAEANVRLQLRHYDANLSPLMTGKLASYFDIGREMKLEVAILPIGVEPASTDWLLVFHGYVEGFDMSDGLAVNAKDLGVQLQQRWIEVDTRVYGSDAGVAVQTVMQQILDDALGAGAVTLLTVGTPSWSIRKYQQKKEPILDALTTLAAQFGWDVRYKWDTGSSSFRLTLYEPARTKTVPDYTLKPSRYIDVRRAGSNKTDVRNVVQVIYSDSNDLDAGGVPKRNTYVASDAASITKYGRQWMELAEASSSQIDTLAEATVMADAALADLKEPKVDFEAEVHLWPYVEVGDLIRWSANNVQHSSDQDLAVVSASHEIAENRARTTVLTRGTPSGPRAYWLGAQAAPGVAPAVPPTTVPTTGTQTRAEIAKAVKAGYVGPAAIQPLSSFESLALNPDFEVNTATDAPPDTWALQTPSQWGTNFQRTDDAYSGANAIRAWAGGGNMRSNWFSVRKGASYNLEVFAKYTGDNTVLNWIRLEVADQNFAILGETAGVTLSGVLTTSYAVYSNTGEMTFANARYARVIIVPSGAAYNAANYATVDSVIVRRADMKPQPTTVVNPASGFQVNWAAWGDANYHDPQYFKDPSGIVHLEGLAKNLNAASLNVFALPVGYRPSKSLIFAGKGSGGFLEIRVSHTDGMVTVVNPTLNGWHSLAGVSFRAEQ